mmetsp:Transcript_29162/g.77048  ORF Transcript_29162/g.77048 Transcript_29162/m.77048 type:complete len:218 (-) Transcript_29162:173-826(-)
MHCSPSSVHSSTLLGHFCKNVAASCSPTWFKLNGTFQSARNSPSNSWSGRGPFPAFDRFCSTRTTACTNIFARVSTSSNLARFTSPPAGASLVSSAPRFTDSATDGTAAASALGATTVPGVAPATVAFGVAAREALPFAFDCADRAFAFAAAFFLTSSLRYAKSACISCSLVLSAGCEGFAEVVPPSCTNVTMCGMRLRVAAKPPSPTTRNRSITNL